jgi:hypothetical protein
MDELIKRWQAAAVRAQEENVRVILLAGGYFAASSSHPLKAYHLDPSPAGWGCECVANADYHLPCKHLAALAQVLDLDLLADMRVDSLALGPSHEAA